MVTPTVISFKLSLFFSKYKNYSPLSNTHGINRIGMLTPKVNTIKEIDNPSTRRIYQDI
jgi:hypothetical protein